jgi:DNA-binding NarL/FixJ family response regulator
MALTHPEIPVIVVSSQNTTSVVVECQKYGAIGYVLKHAPRSELLEMLREAIDGLEEGDEPSA